MEKTMIKKLLNTLLIACFCSLAATGALAAEKQAAGTAKSISYFTMESLFKNVLQHSTNRAGEDNNWIHRWLWNHRMDYNPDGSFKYYSLDMKDCINKINKSREDRLLSETGWVPVGPIEMPPTYEPRSCYSMGRINCVAFHPTVAGTFWIGTPGGGIWKTIDDGKTWLPQGDFLSTLAVSDIAVDPKNPDILYAATGDMDGESAVRSSKAHGVIKSTDGGTTWNLTNLVNDGTYLNSLLKKVIINPLNTNKIIVAGSLGIWRTQDAGDSWEYICDSTITDLEIDPKNPRNIYASMVQLSGTYAAGILKSTNFGDTWTLLNTGMPSGAVSRLDVAVSPADNNYIYAIAVKSNTSGLHSFYRSTNGGDTWTAKELTDSTDNMLGSWGGDKTDKGGQGWYDLVLLADPKNKDKVYTGGINIWMTENGGTDWDMVSFWVYCFGASTHADQHYAAYNPVDGHFYWCNDGGVYRTKTLLTGSKQWIREWMDKSAEDAKPGHPDFKFPTEWENLSSGLAITEFYKMSMCRNQNNVLAAGSQDNSCFYYNSGDWLNYIPNYDGMETMIDNDNPDIFYGVWQNGGLCKTTDGGKTLYTGLADTIRKTESGKWVTPVGMDPIHSETIYIGFKNLWRSQNGGFLWEKVLDFQTLTDTVLNKNSLSVIKISAVNGDYMAVYKDYGWYRDSTGQWKITPGELWLTEDGCKSWKKSADGLPLDAANIISIEYDDKDPKNIWAAIYSYNSTINTFLTTDGGESWANVSRTMPASVQINAIVHQPGSLENTLYAGTNYGVYFTNDSMQSWQPYGSNLPNAIVKDLEIQFSTRELYAATYGRGVWKTNIMPDAVSDAADNKTSISIYPNPSQGRFTLTVDSPSATGKNGILVTIVDVTGRKVYEEKLSAESFPANVSIDTNLGSGVYFVRLFMEGKSYSARLLINR